MKAFSMMRPDRCPKCEIDKTLILYDMNNIDVKLTLIINTNRYDQLKGRRLSYFHCRKCGSDFPINWINDKNIPYPMEAEIMRERILPLHK